MRKLILGLLFCGIAFAGQSAPIYKADETSLHRTGGTFGLKSGGTSPGAYTINGDTGIGTTAGGIAPTAGRRYLTIKGASDAGIVEYATAKADASGVLVGAEQFTDINSLSAEKRVAFIGGLLSGTTANDRGGRLRFSTKADGASGLVARLEIDENGLAAFKNSVTVDGTLGVTGNTAIGGANDNSALLYLRQIASQTPLSSAPNGALQIGNSSITNGMFDIGTAGSTSWIQARDRRTSQPALDLAIQPLGGATTIGGTLGVTGNFAVNTNKITVTASNGNLTSAGTVDAQGQLKGKGTATNDDAATGYIGEFKETAVTETISPAGSQQADCSSLALTAGDWDLTLAVIHTYVGATETTWSAGIGTVSGNSTTGMVSNKNYFVLTSSARALITVPRFRVSIAGNTTYYGKVLTDYTSGTPDFYCYMTARRVR